MPDFAGALRERVIIEPWLAARDTAGAEVGSWGPGETVNAAVNADGGGAVEGEARRSRRRWRVVVRAGPAVGLTSRLRWRERVLKVLAVEDDPALPDRLTLRVEDWP